ncbi:helix-turn-helix domain-containing protein [Nocardiopsis exhalans]|uniref:Helix-turn-helix domain-containing protein n=1 Tax=Nocardiopsis exhalans TaxID=163604 RepID=A0ABY5D9N9_9ACTN|nr:helix-turn-helix transcriptional regulator [Nocardiopsis exhalans]USY19685.1 helix-turn-helix domain-containing protein [Nocardiopsis exhalans]
MSHTITIGPAIRAIRRSQGVTQLDLADRAGVSGPYLTNIESGVKQPSFDTALRIAHALGVPPEAITYSCPTCRAERSAA